MSNHVQFSPHSRTNKTLAHKLVSSSFTKTEFINWKNKPEDAENKPCPVPHMNYKFHLWKDCSLNPKSSNFRFNGQGVSGGRFGGQGNAGARLSGGRGNGGCGGGRGYNSDRGNNNNNNFQNHSNNETHWVEQPSSQQCGMPQDHYYVNHGPPGGCWQAGGSSNGQSSSHQNNNISHNHGGW
jgi:hypothetical protein